MLRLNLGLFGGYKPLTTRSLRERETFSLTGGNLHRVDDSTAAPTSLNSWIWVCSNIENTLELAPSALFLAFLGACMGRGGGGEGRQLKESEAGSRVPSLGESQPLICEMGV